MKTSRPCHAGWTGAVTSANPPGARITFSHHASSRDLDTVSTSCSSVEFSDLDKDRTSDSDDVLKNKTCTGGSQ